MPTRGVEERGEVPEDEHQDYCRRGGTAGEAGSNPAPPETSRAPVHLTAERLGIARPKRWVIREQREPLRDRPAAAGAIAARAGGGSSRC